MAQSLGCTILLILLSITFALFAVFRYTVIIVFLNLTKIEKVFYNLKDVFIGQNVTHVPRIIFNHRTRHNYDYYGSKTGKSKNLTGCKFRYHFVVITITSALVFYCGHCFAILIFGKLRLYYFGGIANVLRSCKRYQHGWMVFEKNKCCNWFGCSWCNNFTDRCFRIRPVSVRLFVLKKSCLMKHLYCK